MKNVINNTAFIGRYTIANQIAADVALVINDFVTTYQPVFLRQLLGPVLYKQFQDWYDTDVPRDTAGVNAVWQALLDGANYTKVGSNAPAYSEKISVSLTSYVYDRYQRNNITQTTGVGEKEVDAQNASQASVEQKLIDRWLEMVDNVRGNFDYLNKALATNADWRDWYRHCCGWSFFADDVDKYPSGEIFEKINRYGL